MNNTVLLSLWAILCLPALLFSQEQEPADIKLEQSIQALQTDEIKASIENLKITQKQVNEICKLAETTKYFSVDISTIARVKDEYKSLNEIPLDQIKLYLNIVDPIQLRVKPYEEEEKIQEQIVKVVELFLSMFKQDFLKLFAENEITNIEISLANTNELLQREFKLMLLQNEITNTQGEKIKRTDFWEIFRLNGIAETDIVQFFGLNINEESWREKMTFMLNNDGVDFFKSCNN